MDLPEQRTRLVAGSPIEVGEHRLLPSVLVSTVDKDQSQCAKLRYVKLRPTSLVVTSSQDTNWIEIPNETMDTLSKMAGAAGIIAFISLCVIVVVRFLRRL